MLFEHNTDVPVFENMKAILRSMLALVGNKADRLRENNQKVKECKNGRNWDNPGGCKLQCIMRKPQLLGNCSH